MDKPVFSSAAREALELRNLIYQKVISVGAYKNAIWEGCNEDNSKNLMEVFRENLLGYDIVLWEREHRNVACRGSEIFENSNVEEHYLPPRPQLWMDSPLWQFHTLSEGGARVARVPVGSARIANFIIPYHDIKEVFAGTIYFDLGKSYDSIKFRLLPGRKIGQVSTFLYAPFIGMASFMAQEFVSLDKQNINPRSLKRISRNEHVPDIHSVVLRRKTSDGQSAPSSSDREYSCQWRVRGHWRKQWHPSTREHRPKFISPYIAGPENKPLRVAEDTVIHVRR